MKFTVRCWSEEYYKKFRNINDENIVGLSILWYEDQVYHKIRYEWLWVWYVPYEDIEDIEKIKNNCIFEQVSNPYFENWEFYYIWEYDWNEWVIRYWDEKLASKKCIFDRVYLEEDDVIELNWKFYFLAAVFWKVWLIEYWKEYEFEDKCIFESIDMEKIKIFDNDMFYFAKFKHEWNMKLWGRKLLLIWGCWRWWVKFWNEKRDSK